MALRATTASSPINAHTDNPSSTVADNVISTAQLYNNPVVSGRQLLGWLDYRNDSSFGSLSWNATTNPELHDHDGR